MRATSKALAAIYAALDDLNRQRPARTRLSQQPDTPLLGAPGQLDSLGLITFVVALEQRIEDMLGTGIILTDGVLLSDPDGPFSTVATLAAYIDSIVGGDSRV